MTPKELEEHALGRLLSHLSRKRWHVAVSLTKNCPLACRHCIVSAQKGTFDRSPQVEELTRWLVAGIEGASERLLALTFTGGESPLADIAFKEVGEAAKQKHIACGLITSGYFAKSPTAAENFFLEHSFLTSLTVSFDEFHEEFLPLSFGINALRAAKKLGLTISARHSGQFRGDYYHKLQSILEPLFGDVLENQELVFGGRASELSGVAAEAAALAQCPTDGPHISASGQILPCCSTIIHQESNPCLALGTISDISFAAMLDRMERRPIINILRVWGWDHVVDNIPQLLSIHPNLRAMGGCAQCEKITCNSESAKLVNEWVDDTNCAQISNEAAIRFIEQVRAERPPSFHETHFGNGQSTGARL